MTAGGTDPLYDILCFLLLKACRQQDRRDFHVGQTVCAVADAAGQMNVTLALTGVVEVADAVLL